MNLAESRIDKDNSQYSDATFRRKNCDSNGIAASYHSDHSARVCRPGVKNAHIPAPCLCMRGSPYELHTIQPPRLLVAVLRIASIPLSVHNFEIRIKLRIYVDVFIPRISNP